MKHKRRERQWAYFPISTSSSQSSIPFGRGSNSLRVFGLERRWIIASSTVGLQLSCTIYPSSEQIDADKLPRNHILTRVRVSCLKEGYIYEKYEEACDFEA